MAKYSNIGKLFFQDIFQNNSFDGYVIFYVKRDNKMEKFNYVKASDISSFLDNLEINPNMDYYFTINTFKNPKGKTEPNNRKTNLFGFNGIVIDLDCHDSRKLIEKDFDDIVELIDKGTNKYHLPFYNYIVRTGRGIQIYYLFKPCASALGFLVDMAKEILIEFYKELVYKMPQFNVDAGASRRASGIYRMPYTINQAIKKESTIIRWDNLEKKDINVFLDIVSATKFRKFVDFPHLEQQTKCIEEKPNVARCEKVLKEVSKYQYDKIKSNGEHENRNRTCFAYASFLLHLYSLEETLEKMKIFNGKYHYPLSQERIKQIVFYCYENHISKDKTKFLYMKNKTILELLEIESGEYDIIYTEDFVYKNLYELEREKRKEKQRDKRRKIKRVKQLLSKDMTYKEIAQKVGVSISTVSRISKSSDVKRKNLQKEKPWEALGISRATYYRKYK